MIAFVQAEVVVRLHSGGFDAHVAQGFERGECTAEISSLVHKIRFERQV